MIIDVEKYATSHWSSFFKSIADISKSDSGVSLVESDKEILCFDDIVADYFDENKKPSSADGLTFSHKSINLIEFKTGFKKLITKANYKPEEVTCEKHEGEICEEYGALLLRYHSSKKEILMDSLKMKAIESYVFLDKQIIPLCHNSGCERSKNLNYVVVIDGDDVESMEDILSSVTDLGGSADNYYSDIRKSLSRFLNNIDASGNPYYYDDIVVLSSTDFKNELELYA